MIHLDMIIVTFVITAGIYGFFELLIRRKERLNIIEKLGDKLDPSALKNSFTLPSIGKSRVGFSTLKIACLLIGLGLGFIVGLIFDISLSLPDKMYEAADNYNIARTVSNLRELVYIASVLIFGGIGLVVSFLVEKKSVDKESK